MDTSKEKLLAMIVLPDESALIVFGEPVQGGHLRGFVLEDRKTGEVYAEYRQKYPNGHKHWYEIRPKPGMAKKEAEEYLISGLKTVATLSIQMYPRIVDGKSESKLEAQAFVVPEDCREDGDKTLQWLLEQDLVEITGEMGPDGDFTPLAKGVN
jgi:hypothetical protein